MTACSTVPAQVRSPWLARISARFCAEGLEHAVGLVQVEDHAVVLAANGMVLVERAAHLVEWFERDVERTEGTAGRRVGMHRAVHVGTAVMDRAVDAEGGIVDHRPAIDELALVIDQRQVVGTDLAELEAERVHPEIVGRAGHALTDVAGDPLVESVASEDAIGRCQLHLQLARLRRVGERADMLRFATLGRGIQRLHDAGSGIDHGKVSLVFDVFDSVHPCGCIVSIRLCRPSSASNAHPIKASVRSISARRFSATSRTPCSPPTARP